MYPLSFLASDAGFCLDLSKRNPFWSGFFHYFFVSPTELSEGFYLREKRLFSVFLFVNSIWNPLPESYNNTLEKLIVGALVLRDFSNVGALFKTL